MGIQRKKRRGEVFFLLQSEYGDIYHLQIECITQELPDGTITVVPKKMKLSYFDTIQPCTTMVILQTKVGSIEAPEHLFLASEVGNSYFLRINPQPTLEITATSADEVGEEEVVGAGVGDDTTGTGEDAFEYFQPKQGVN
uniref:Pre-mRNA-splicing factor rse1 n=1 Tax=Lygus hesperus TaxID=30085 RepID=A0A0A9W7M1_LYGHE